MNQPTKKNGPTIELLNWKTKEKGEEHKWTYQKVSVIPSGMNCDLGSTKKKIFFHSKI